MGILVMVLLMVVLAGVYVYNLTESIRVQMEAERKRELRNERLLNSNARTYRRRFY